MIKNKQAGFTLVELLAVIIILGIILAIVIPGVSDIINTSYTKAYEQHLKTLEEAAKAYTLHGNIKLENGEQKRVEISEMIDAGLIDEIKDPKDKFVCEGYAIISKTNNDYNFQPYLKCAENYVSENYE